MQPLRLLTLVAVSTALACNKSPEPPAVAAPASPAPNASPQKSVIILCTGNTCRSQMAEAFWKKYAPDWYVVSAGTKPKSEVYPLAVAAMKEKGIDISHARPKGPEQFLTKHFDLVITVCHNAEKECPNFPNPGRHLHWPFDDPPKARGDDQEKMKVTRRVRDEIEQKIRTYLGTPSN